MLLITKWYLIIVLGIMALVVLFFLFSGCFFRHIHHAQDEEIAESVRKPVLIRT